MTRKSWSIPALVAVQVFVMVAAVHAGEPPVKVPEPTTLALLGAGAAIAEVGAWWRHRK